jgi:SAM-dependent methyltransferase
MGQTSIILFLRNQSSPFVSLVLSRLPLNNDQTVLDIGAGPGTLSLPIARKVRSVTAVDYSAGMLAALKDNAMRTGIDNIRTVQVSWEDDWSRLGIEQHDIAIASRSLAVADLKGALCKLNRYASNYVFIVDRISPTPFDPEAFQAIGRPFSPGPDYIYTLNMLYSMGIHPQVDILRLENTVNFTTSMKPLVRILDVQGSHRRGGSAPPSVSCRQSHQPPGRADLHQADNPPQWACIWWQKVARPMMVIFIHMTASNRISTTYCHLPGKNPCES